MSTPVLPDGCSQGNGRPFPGPQGAFGRTPRVVAINFSVTLNHMRAVKAWTDANDARVSLDLRNWELEVRCRNRHFRLRPRFRAGLRVPARWPVVAPEGDYILKRSAGSFGGEIAGPYRADRPY